MNSPFEFDGRGYCPCDLMTATRRSQTAVMELAIKNRIEQLDSPNATYKTLDLKVILMDV